MSAAATTKKTQPLYPPNLTASGSHEETTISEHKLRIIKTKPPITNIEKMAPQITDDEIDDLLYFARTGDKEELTTTLLALAEREKVSPAEILAAAEDEGKSTCLHMATGNGHLGMVSLIHFQVLVIKTASLIP